MLLLLVCQEISYFLRRLCIFKHLRSTAHQTFLLAYLFSSTPINKTSTPIPYTIPNSHANVHENSLTTCTFFQIILTQSASSTIHTFTHKCIYTQILQSHSFLLLLERALHICTYIQTYTYTHVERRVRAPVQIRLRVYIIYSSDVCAHARPPRDDCN